MPELPEVETVRAGLAPYLTGAKILAVDIHDARSLKRHPGSAKDFEQTLVGCKVSGVVRRGKFLWFPLETKKTERKIALVGHLGMSGQILIRPEKAVEDKLTRVVIHTEAVTGEKIEMRFIDQRLFGSLAIDELVPTDDGKFGGFCPEMTSESWFADFIPMQAAHIRRDPLDENFDANSVFKKFNKKSSGIKRVLLDQQTLSGIGNIYADEALWRSRLHYDQPANTISKMKAKELLSAVTEILQKAVAEGGTSFDEQYKNVNGESGYFAVSLNAYGMTDLPCKRCGTAIKRENWMNRGSHFCPKCQRLKH